MRFTKGQIKMQELRKAFSEAGIGFYIRLEKVYFEGELCFCYEEQKDNYCILEKRDGFINAIGGEYIFLKYCSLDDCINHITQNKRYKKNEKKS